MARKTGKETGKEAAGEATEVKRVSNTLEIKAFIHCAMCLMDMPAGQSPQGWSRLDVGWTQWGLQVWCRRHECNVCNIDFEGAVHPAETTRTRKPS
jgi:hypothetical protein